MLQFNNKKEKKFAKAFAIEEVQLIHQLFECLRLRTEKKSGIDIEVFFKFSPIPGMWTHRIFEFMRGLDGSKEEDISFKNFLESLRLFCRSSYIDDCLFAIFDIGQRGFLDWNELQIMLINLPNLGFTMRQNQNETENMYRNIHDSMIECVEAKLKAREVQRVQQTTLAFSSDFTLIELPSRPSIGVINSQPQID